MQLESGIHEKASENKKGELLHLGHSKLHWMSANTFAELYAINDDNITLGLYKRTPNREITRFLERFSQSDFTETTQTCRADEAALKLEKRLEAYAPLEPNGFAAFINELDTTIQDFAAVVGVDDVKVMLGVLKTNYCQKFHVDLYHLRLLCTYFGEGTEWVEDGSVNRKMLGKNNEEIITDASKVHQLRPFDIAIIKGEYFKEYKGRGLVHRSPSIMQNGGTRVMLRVDLCYD